MPITLATLEQDKKGTSVWVLNNTEGATRSRIIFTVPQSAGNGQDIVDVPLTFIPVDLSLQASKDILTRSTDFRRTVGKGLVILLSEAEANAKLEEDGASEEVERLRHQFLKSGEAKPPESMRPPGQEDPGHQSDVQKSEAKAAAAVVQLAVMSENYTDTEMLNSVKSLGKLTLDDFKYLGRRTGAHPKTQAFLRVKVKELKDQLPKGGMSDFN